VIRVIGLLLVLPLAAQAEPIQDTSCKRNLKDGNIVVDDTKLPVLPNGYHWTVLQFDRGSSRDGIWQNGQCKVEKLHNG
jgi:hypothetical protein